MYCTRFNLYCLSARYQNSPYSSSLRPCLYKGQRNIVFLQKDFSFSAKPSISFESFQMPFKFPIHSCPVRKLPIENRIGLNLCWEGRIYWLLLLGFRRAILLHSNESIHGIYMYNQLDYHGGHFNLNVTLKIFFMASGLL